MNWHTSSYFGYGSFANAKTLNKLFIYLFVFDEENKHINIGFGNPSHWLEGLRLNRQRVAGWFLFQFRSQLLCFTVTFCTPSVPAKMTLFIFCTCFVKIILFWFHSNTVIFSFSKSQHIFPRLLYFSYFFHSSSLYIFHFSLYSSFT